jgi:hypothetical protein
VQGDTADKQPLATRNFEVVSSNALSQQQIEDVEGEILPPAISKPVKKSIVKTLLRLAGKLPKIVRASPRLSGCFNITPPPIWL